MPRYEVREWVDVLYLQRRMHEFAAAQGFPRLECAELAIVVSELASNILKYGVQGSIDMEPWLDLQGEGLRIVATDCGPPFNDLVTALKDGHDDRGPIDPARVLSRRGIGGGLGAIVRLTHDFAVLHEATGKRIEVKRYRNIALARR